jgi:hypothetical protein
VKAAPYQAGQQAGGEGVPGPDRVDNDDRASGSMDWLASAAIRACAMGGATSW